MAKIDYSTKNDPAHIETDRIIDDLTKRFEKEYSQAQKEVEEKLYKFYAKFSRDDAEMLSRWQNGEITKERYIEWRETKLLTGKRWSELKDRIARDYVNANTEARNMILDKMSDVYAINYNYAGYMIEKQANIDTGWTLYNRQAVENLVKDDDFLLPFPRTESPTAQMLRERMDLIWNRQHLASAMTQGILQGESIGKIADRLQKVTDMNRSAALRNARTMMTGTQNKARNDAFSDLREKGIEIAEYWEATLDGFTRHSHRLLHGEEKDYETGEYSNGCRFPGDPYGKPAEVYNCRCAEVGFPKGFPPDIPKYSEEGMGDLTFEEWQDMKTVHDPNYQRPKVEEKKEFNVLQQLKDENMQLLEFRDKMGTNEYREFLYKVQDFSMQEGMTPKEYFRDFVEGKIENEQFAKYLEKTITEDMFTDPFGHKVLSDLEQTRIERLPLTKIDSPKSFEKFVEDVGGGDRTKGSCLSLSYCYAVNEAGYDVRDFRGGESQDYFANYTQMRNVAQMKGVNSIIERSKTPIKTAMARMGEIEPDKKYILAVCGHAAIVENSTENGLRYLELQASAGENGWNPLNADELKWRFGAPKTSKYERPMVIIDVDSLAKNENFPKMMEYINTAEEQQRKGWGGGRK